jgi:DNA-directed RNA polymerase specialized sigma24 family protein
MALLPNKNIDQQAGKVLSKLRKGDTHAFSNFIWQYLERCYAVSYLACHNSVRAEDLTLQSFDKAFSSLAHTNFRQLEETVWEWLCQYVVQACADYHAADSDPSAKVIESGSELPYSHVDWEKTIILGAQRVKKCLGSLPDSHRAAFVLRHQLDLGYEQIAAVLNQDVDTVMSWLFMARVELVRCLAQ